MPFVLEDFIKTGCKGSGQVAVPSVCGFLLPCHLQMSGCSRAAAGRPCEQPRVGCSLANCVPTSQSSQFSPLIFILYPMLATLQPHWVIPWP